MTNNTNYSLTSYFITRCYPLWPILSLQRPKCLIQGEGGIFTSPPYVTVLNITDIRMN